jgi:DNA-binding MurR/RpiR family transcriptional regulator
VKLVERETDFRRLVQRHFQDLPPQQQVIAEYLVEHLSDVPFLSVPELARRSGASEATIVRLSQRLGYDGFSGLKADLLDAVRERVTPSADDEDASDSIDPEILTAVARQEISNIRRTLDQLDREAFRHAVSTLFRADHIYSFGVGISTHFAEIFTYLLIQIGLRATSLSPGFSSPLEQTVSMRPTDLLVVFSFPPYSRQTLDLVRTVRDKGVPTAALTDRLTAPIATLASVTLSVRTEGMMFTNSFASIAMLLNALVTEISITHRSHTAEAVSQINRYLEQDENLIP